jgi:hypothetical protein
MYQLWTWILRHYSDIPEVKPIALRWFYDKMMTYGEQKTVCERVIQTKEEPFMSILKTDMMISSSVTAYRIFNPETNAIEVQCQSGSTYTPCSSKIAELIMTRLGPGPLAIPGDVGVILGFLATKEGRIVFKTLDTTKALTKSSVGAECGNTSNLKEHHPRVTALQAAAAADARIGPLMLPDSEESFEAVKADAKARMAARKPEHMRDITHQPLCLYMEFLTRLLDVMRLGGKRWFLSPVEAMAVGLKGKRGA